MNNLLICKGKSRNSCSFLAFLLFTFLLVAPTAAQTLKENNITLRVQNEPVENVFNKISEQTNFKFIIHPCQTGIYIFPLRQLLSDEGILMQKHCLKFLPRDLP